MNVAVTIDRLILDGLPVAGGAHGARLQAAVEAELTRLIGERGLGFASPVVLSCVSAGGIALAADATPERVGTEIAGALHRRFSAPVPAVRGGGVDR
jgi:hypothetical protein